MPRKKLAYYGYTKHRLKTFLSFHAFSLTLIGADFSFFSSEGKGLTPSPFLSTPLTFL